jgi:hypothetical protein
METGVPNDVQILDLTCNSISSLERDGFKVILLFTLCIRFSPVSHLKLSQLCISNNLFYTNT